MAAVYAWGIARNHPFVDGNKRTALITAVTFLELNGYKILVGPEWVDLMVRLASDPAFARQELVDAFARAMGHDEPVT
ncbi:MAG: type II toxin-antitoxin system death-on-curing family toxin [Deltaproteobacteria bacterium]|nr:MAG: type II toxin-antitoxin system death-on-curing family toxin [Deltaproteobacteria bacterium]